MIRSHWGRVRAAVVWAALTPALDRLGPAPLDVLDAGGGTGGFAVPLAALGHRVTVVDPSPDSLAALDRRAAEEGVAITGVLGDLGTLLDVAAPGSVDVVLCHSVLELVDDPAAAVATLARVLKPGGLASVVAANRTAAVVSKALGGRFTEANAALSAGPGWSRAELVDLLGRSGFDVAEVHGVRVFTDLVSGAVLDADPAAFDDLVALELAASGLDPYRDLATQLHVLANLSPSRGTLGA